MRKGSQGDKQLVIDILVSAFISNKEMNSINYIVKQDGSRKKRMEILMEFLFFQALWFGDIFISDNNSSCLLVKYSDREKTSLKSVFQRLKLALGCIGILKVPSVLKREGIVKSYHPKEAFITPIILGTKQNSIGKGNAARLLLEILKAHEHNKYPVFLDVADESNVKLYEKFGFYKVKTVNKLGFKMRFMRKDFI